MNTSGKSDTSSVCDDDQPLLRMSRRPSKLTPHQEMEGRLDQPLLRSSRSPTKLTPHQEMEGRLALDINSVVNTPLSARGEDNAPYSARAKISNFYHQKKNRVEILTQKLEKMEEFFRKSNSKGTFNKHPESKLQRGSSSNSLSEMAASLNNSQHGSPIRNLIRIPSKKIKIPKKVKANVESTNVRKKHRSYADAVSMSRSKQMLTEPSTEAVFETDDPDTKIVKKKKVRRNSDSAIGSSHHT